MNSKIFRTSDGVGLQTHSLGNPSSDFKVLFLHGFPQSAYCFRHQMKALSEKGVYCLALDQRGYGESDRPSKLSDYATPRLVEDVKELIDSQGGKFFVVGHDWGGIVAWGLVETYPEKVKSYAIFNCPHPRALLLAIAKDSKQKRMSWYIIVMQIPFLPERIVALKDFKFLREVLLRTSAPGTFQDEDIKTYLKSWRRKGTLTSMFSWYRALGKISSKVVLNWGKERKATLPPGVLVCGKKDMALSLPPFKKSAEYVPGCELVEHPGSHWLPEEDPGFVKDLMIKKFKL